MSITSVKYNKGQDGSNISVTIVYENGEKWSAPLDGANRHWREVEEWVAEGNTIEENE